MPNKQLPNKMPMPPVLVTLLPPVLETILHLHLLVIHVDLTLINVNDAHTKKHQLAKLQRIGQSSMYISPQKHYAQLMKVHDDDYYANCTYVGGMPQQLK